MALDIHFEELVSSLSKAGLAPGSTALIPKEFKLSTELVVKFGERAVSLGNFFKTGETKVAPTVSFASEVRVEKFISGPKFNSSLIQGSSNNYTLLLVDPDAPTPEDPKFAYWRHWVLPGLQPSNAGTATLSQPALTEYLGPGPKDEKS
jgi:phosphatidylethanolamine-binding protein